MPPTDEPNATTAGEPRTAWRWATVLAVHPCLTVGAVLCALLFGLVSTATKTFGLPGFLPLAPGALLLLFLGVAHLYTPIYVVGLWLDRRRWQATGTRRRLSRMALFGGGAQTVYFVVPVVQAYGVETFEELVFGSVEFAALLCTGAVTVRYLAARDSGLPGAPAPVSLWARVWSRITSL